MRTLYFAHRKIRSNYDTILRFSITIFIMRIVTNMKKHALYNFFHKLEFTPCKGEQPPQNMEKKKKMKKRMKSIKGR